MNDGQLKAVSHETGPALVFAGPGTGKTQTITHHILFLLENLSVSPDKILVITFTKEAACQMRDRFIKLCPSAGLKVHFGTFHSVFYKILRTYGDTKKIATEKEKIRILGLLTHDKSEAAALSDKISRYKSGTSLELTERRTDRRDEFLRKLKLYNGLLRQNNLLDFDDILIECKELLLKDISVRTAVSERFDHILVDEFQDSSGIQYDVLKLMSSGMKSKNIFAVGDENQSIYNFRGAKFGIFNDFLNDYENTTRYRLNVNYRNEETILKAADNVMGIRERSVCRRVTGEGFNLVIFKSKHEELEELKRKVSESVCTGAKTCILARTNKDLDFYRSLFSDAEDTDSSKDRSESHGHIYDLVADLIDLTLTNRRTCLLKVLPYLDPYIPRTVFTDEYVDPMKVSVNIKDERIRERVNLLFKHLNMLRPRNPESFVLYVKNVLLAGNALIKEKGYPETFSKIERAAAGSLDLSELAGRLRAETVADSVKEVKDPVSENPCFLTFHAAKGLEFDHVFIPDVTEGHIPKRSAFSETNEEEEKRLLYVAMTRAKEKLYLYTIKSEGNNSVLPSEFLKPLL